MIAALCVEPDGAYSNLPGVDPWDKARDARRYAGPWPVVAHPECQQWGRYEPVGTNLFTATQAEEMVRHMLEGAE